MFDALWNSGLPALLGVLVLFVGLGSAGDMRPREWLIFNGVLWLVIAFALAVSLVVYGGGDGG